MGPRRPSQQRKERGTGTWGRTELNGAQCVPGPSPSRADPAGPGHPADGARTPARPGGERLRAEPLPRLREPDPGPAPRRHSLEAVLARAATLLPADLLEDLRKEERRHGRPTALPPFSPQPPPRRGPTWSRTVPGPTRTVTRRPLGASTDTAAPPPPAAAIFRRRASPARPGRSRPEPVLLRARPAAPGPHRRGLGQGQGHCSGPAAAERAVAHQSRPGGAGPRRDRQAALGPGRSGSPAAGAECGSLGARGAGGSGGPCSGQAVGGSGCSPGTGRGLPPALPAGPRWGRLWSRCRLAAPWGTGGEPATRPALADGACVVIVWDQVPPPGK